MAETLTRRCVLLAILYCLFQLARCNYTKINFREKEKQVLDQILDPGRYDARMRPFQGPDGRIFVLVNTLVTSISKIDDFNMEYSIQLILRQLWLDERLRFIDFEDHPKHLTLTEASGVWTPDLFFTNEIESHFHKPKVYIRIFPYGHVLYSTRISLTLSCPMNLKLYPLDRQVCSLKMGSYSWTTDDILFIWKMSEPVQVAKNLHLPGFTLEKFLTANHVVRTDSGDYCCLKIDLLFKRDFIYYLIQIYISFCLLVIVSWVPFWLDQGAALARVSLGVTTLFTMAMQTSKINTFLPPVSYIKAIDVWTGVCLTFVFGALLEFALVNYTLHRENMKKKRREMESAQNMDAASDLIDTTFAIVSPDTNPLMRQSGDSLALEKVRQREVPLQPPRPNCCKIWLSKFPMRSKRIDVISRIIFPLVFVLFNLVYWSTYL